MSMDVSPEDDPESTPSDTLELFEESPPEPPPPKPQRSKSGTRRQPAAVQPLVIPSRTPTQPVLVAGKSRENLNTDAEMNSELVDNKLKPKSPDKQRSNKHKRIHEYCFLICDFYFCYA